MAKTRTKTVTKSPNTRTGKSAKRTKSITTTTTPTRREYDLQRRQLRNERIKETKRQDTIKAIGTAAAKNIGATGGSVAVNTQTPMVTNAIISAASTTNTQGTEYTGEDKEYPGKDVRP